MEEAKKMVAMTCVIVRPFNAVQISKLKEDAQQRIRRNQSRNRRTAAENDLDTFNELNVSTQSRADYHSPEPESPQEVEDIEALTPHTASFNCDEDWVDDGNEVEKNELDIFLDAKAAYQRT
ncbi:hypothetical protein PM082_009411 [Marasmius tenuissimus]|nr:hypothetical protein PM082_009411 [Marasmius tenuissimus]